MATFLIELHYLPCIAYFSALHACTELIVEKNEHYQKQTFRNRCYLKGPHQQETLIIPIIHPHGKAAVSEICIDYNQKWLNNHWRTIRTAYGNAPFFEYYGPDLHDVLFTKPPLLYDLNFALMTMCLKWLNFEPVVKETERYTQEVATGVIDLRDIIKPKNQEGCNRFYKTTEYQQVFGSMFVPNLSLIDLVFNQGPGAWEIVKASATK